MQIIFNNQDVDLFQVGAPRKLQMQPVTNY